MHRSAQLAATGRSWPLHTACQHKSTETTEQHRAGDSNVELQVPPETGEVRPLHAESLNSMRSMLLLLRGSNCRCVHSRQSAPESTTELSVLLHVPTRTIKECPDRQQQREQCGRLFSGCVLGTQHPVRPHPPEQPKIGGAPNYSRNVHACQTSRTTHSSHKTPPTNSLHGCLFRCSSSEQPAFPRQCSRSPSVLTRTATQRIISRVCDATRKAPPPPPLPQQKRGG